MEYDQFLSVTEWQNETFPNATPLSKIAHLRKELRELVKDLKRGGPNRRLEYADCFLLLYGSAAKDGMSYTDICEAIDEKMKINYTKEWNDPQPNGIVEHKK